MKPRFRVHVDPNSQWISFVALNEQARATISGKKVALRPWNVQPASEEQRKEEIAMILWKTDGCPRGKKLTDYYPYN